MDLSKIEIILVEDNPDDADLTIRAFKKQGLDKNVIHIKDGEEALDFIFSAKVVHHKSFNPKTKVILLDLHLPKVSGEEILIRLKEDPATKQIPVVILTGTDDDPVIEKCKTLGAADYIVKPVTLEGFIEVIGRLDIYWL
jgi:two-component system response regulator